MKKTVFMVAASVAWMTVIADGNRVVYENDFATRTSAGAVPYGGWRAVNYVAGQLLANTNYAAAAQFVDDDLQDNWLKAPNTCRNNAYIDDDNNNYVARIGDDSTRQEEAPNKFTGGHVIIRQRIGNTFTNGIVTVTFDMLPPVSWWFYSSHPNDANYNRCARLHLGNENAYTASPSSNNTPIRIGASYYNGARRIYQLDGNGATYSTEQITRGNWLRFVVTVNMDTRKWGYSCYDLGTAHPTMATATPATPFHTASDLDFVATDSPVTSISTISIDGYAVLAGESAAYFDNIRIAHNGTECYVNDFNTRKSRSLAPSATTTTYAAPVSVFDTLSYPVSNNIINVGSMTTAGFDGWKQRHVNGKGMLKIDGSNHYLSFGLKSGLSFNIAAQPFGMVATNGTLKFRGDLRMPTSWFGSSPNDRYAYFILGNDQMYTATDNAQYGNGRYLMIGGKWDNSSTTNTVFYRDENSSNVIGANIGFSAWYRIIVTVNLDAGRFGYEIYKQPNASSAMSDANGTLVESKSNLLGEHGITSLSCFGIAAYYATEAWFDNVRVTYIPSGSDVESAIYQNTMTARFIYRNQASLAVGNVKSNPSGVDGWTGLGTAANALLMTNDDVPVMNGGDVSLAFNDGDATAVHDLGGEYRGGEMTAQADICAPTSWQDTSGCANIWFGGDQYHEGNLNGGEYNYEKMAAFGFGITNTTFAAFRGDCSGGGAWETSGATTAGHWYRFLVFSQNRTSTVLVYDMGTEQPTLATATPKTPVATFSGLPFRRNVAVSCVGVSAMGVKNPTAWSHLLPGGTDVRLKVDNIKFSHIPSGTVIYFR